MHICMEMFVIIQSLAILFFAGFQGQGLANMAWAYAKAGHPDEPLFQVRFNPNPSIRLYICLSVYVSIYIFKDLSTSIYPSIYLSIHLFICLYLSVHVSLCP